MTVIYRAGDVPILFFAAKLPPICDPKLMCLLVPMISCSFIGVTVYTPSNILDQSEVIIMFESGVGVEVLESKGSMSARVYLPWKFIVSSNS